MAAQSFTNSSVHTTTVSTLYPWTSELTSTNISSTTHTKFVSPDSSNASVTSPSQIITTPIQFSTTPGNVSESGCLQILYEDIGTSRIRIWDVMLFVPNVIFLIFVLYRMRRVWHRILSGIGSGGSPIFVTYFTLVALSAILGVIRGIVSMTVDVTTSSGSEANKILWVILRFFLLMAELSVLVFGIAFGHLDSKTSVKRVLFVTTCVALVYSAVQCSLELADADSRFEINDSTRSVYGHGGALFCFITSFIFLLMYLIIAMLPFIRWLQKYFSVPTRRSFYIYVVSMAILNFVSTLGCGLLLYNDMIGLCLLDAYSIAYFTCFAPLVYWTFLSSYFGNTQPSSMLFSYATQVDEGLADVADFDLPVNGITVDSTLSGILVFDSSGEDSYQVSSGQTEEQLHGLRNSTENISMTSPNSDSAHSFIQGGNRS